MKKLIIKYFRHDLIQFEFGRKWIGGTFYLILTGLPMMPFWSDKEITSCQSRTIGKETYVN